jgi:ABC-type Fe3+-hydroxamate transport system substrate-binding protein
MNPLHTLTDDLGRTVQYAFPPKRIVSLCPSQTETLWALGAPLVGRTKFCIHPPELPAAVPEVGGTKQLRLPDLLALNPDLVIAEQEEQTPELVHELEQHGLPVFVTKVESVTEGIQGIRTLGRITGCETPAEHWATRIEHAWQQWAPPTRPLRIAYLIWRNPWMAVGGRTFIHDVLQRLGWHNVYATHEARYPVTDLAELAHLNPDAVLLSSEPYPFTEAHVPALRAAVPGAVVLPVNGEAFSWYGVRMLPALAELQAVGRQLATRVPSVQPPE